MTTQEKFDKAMTHIEKLCDDYYTLTGRKLTHVLDSRIHINADGQWFDGDFMSKVKGEAEQNYAIRWAWNHEAYFLDKVAEASKTQLKCAHWIDSSFSR